ncbi:MAG: lipopolysaccharide core heptose(I) kinase RfaP [Gammaproteobacteria bacterium]|nr:MAG: lipopolysaccharide core heptose(I) kinase RfaP [Gammaproteobacteria bacterium]
MKIKLWLDPTCRKSFTRDRLFDEVAEIEKNAKEEDIYRRGPGRVTLRFERKGKTFFLKRHTGVGWGEIIKELLQFRLPVISAMNEWRALERLLILNIPTLSPVAYGCRGLNPARKESFIITHEMGNTISLEDLVNTWLLEPDPIHLKREVLLQVARIARRLHLAGINHRDLYICHLYLSHEWMEIRAGDPEIHVIDLHRAQIREEVPERWLIKDVASLYYSSMGVGLTRRDYLRFIREYRDMPLRDTLEQEKEFWQAVQERADKLYAKPVVD